MLCSVHELMSKDCTLIHSCTFVHFCIHAMLHVTSNINTLVACGVHFVDPHRLCCGILMLECVMSDGHHYTQLAHQNTVSVNVLDVWKSPARNWLWRHDVRHLHDLAWRHALNHGCCGKHDIYDVAHVFMYDTSCICDMWRINSHYIMRVHSCSSHNPWCKLSHCDVTVCMRWLMCAKKLNFPWLCTCNIRTLLTMPHWPACMM